MVNDNKVYVTHKENTQVSYSGIKNNNAQRLSSPADFLPVK